MTVETTATGAPAIDRTRIAELTEREMAKLAERTPASKQRYERAVKVMPEGRPLLVPGERSLARLRRARRGHPRLGRGRPRVRRLPQRLRRHVHRPRQPDRRRGGQGAGRPRHPLRRPHRRLDRRRRGAHPPLRPAAMAVHQLRHRVDDGRGPPGPRRHRPRRDPQDRGLLPRPPRRGDGLGLPVARGARRSRRSALGSLRRRLSAGDHRADPRGAVQRRRRARVRARTSSRARSPG